jgi:hypothetical protein
VVGWSASQVVWVLSCGILLLSVVGFAEVLELSACKALLELSDEGFDSFCTLPDKVLEGLDWPGRGTSTGADLGELIQKSYFN